LEKQKKRNRFLANLCHSNFVRKSKKKKDRKKEKEKASNYVNERTFFFFFSCSVFFTLVLDVFENKNCKRNRILVGMLKQRKMRSEIFNHDIIYPIFILISNADVNRTACFSVWTNEQAMIM